MSPSKFKLIVLGCDGGPWDNNLSAFMVAPIDSTDFVCVDAGTLLWGITLALKKGAFPEISPSRYPDLLPEVAILRHHIKSYLISHAHLDHMTGLIICSQGDSKKNILAIDSAINFIRDHLFNTASWPNFGSEGEGALHQYTYIRLPLHESKTIPGTSMSVETYPLSHGDSYLSSAFLIEDKGHYFVYIGNTGPDALDQNKYLHTIWKRIAPLIRQDRVRAILLECSFIDSVPDKQLFGHFKPSYLIQELEHLASLVNPDQPQESLRSVQILVAHMKNGGGTSYKEQVQKEIQALNKLNFNLHFPKQADRIEI